jgi:hypothetical protein
VRLAVTDNAGAVTTSTQSVTVAQPSVSLRATSSKLKSRPAVDLFWSGAAGAQIDVRRNGATVRTAPNSGAFTDAAVVRGEYRYRVCEVAGGACSAEVLVQVR